MADTQRDDLQADPSPQAGSAAGEPAAGVPAPSIPAPAVPDPAVPATDVPATDVPASAAAEAPAPAAAPPPAAAAEPTLATTTTVPGRATATAEAGGEWNLLIEKLQQWWGSGELQSLWAQARRPLSLALAVLAVVLVLRVYAGLLAAINGLPLVPGLLELVGLVWVLRQGLPQMLRRSKRAELIEGVQRRWQNFRGRG